MAASSVRVKKEWRLDGRLRSTAQPRDSSLTDNPTAILREGVDREGPIAPQAKSTPMRTVIVAMVLLAVAGAARAEVALQTEP